MNWELHGSFLAWAYDRLVVGGQLTTSDQPDRLLPFFFFTISAFDILHLCGCYKSLPHRRSITLLLTLCGYEFMQKAKFPNSKPIIAVIIEVESIAEGRLMPLGDLIWRLSLQLVTVPSHCVQFSSTLDQTNCSFIFGMRARESQFD